MSLVFFNMAQQPPVGQGLLITQAPRPHSETQHSVGLLWKSDQPDTETSTWHHRARGQTSTPPAGFEPEISAIEPPQNHALNRTATWTGECTVYHGKSESCSQDLYCTNIFTFSFGLNRCPAPELLEAKNISDADWLNTVLKQFVVKVNSSNRWSWKKKIIWNNQWLPLPDAVKFCNNNNNYNSNATEDVRTGVVLLYCWNCLGLIRRNFC